MAIVITCDICGKVIPDEYHRDSVIHVSLDSYGPGTEYKTTHLPCRESPPERQHRESMGHLCADCEASYIGAKKAAFVEIVAIVKSIKDRIRELAATERLNNA